MPTAHAPDEEWAAYYRMRLLSPPLHRLCLDDALATHMADALVVKTGSKERRFRAGNTELISHCISEVVEVAANQVLQRADAIAGGRRIPREATSPPSAAWARRVEESEK